MLLLLVFADHVHDDDHGDDDHWSGGVAVLLRLPNLPVDHLNTFSKCTNTEHNRSTNNNSITLGKATRPKQKKEEKINNNFDTRSTEYTGLTPRTAATRSTSHHHLPDWEHSRTSMAEEDDEVERRKKRFLLLSKHVVAVVVAVILGHVSLIWLHGYLGFFSLCTKLSVSAFPWLNGNATAVAPLPSLKSEACSHCLHVTFKFCLCSFFVMALLF